MDSDSNYFDETKHCNLESEKVWLGVCILFKDDFLTGIKEGVSIETFYFNTCRRLYTFISRCYESEDAIDNVIITEKVKDEELLEMINDCIDISMGADSKYHLRRILDFEYKRKILQTVKQSIKSNSISELPKKLQNFVIYDHKEEVPRSLINKFNFPDFIMSGLAGKYAEVYSSYLESPPSFFYFSFLTALGAIVSRKVKMNSELRQQPRLFMILLGESADDRKSTAINKTIEFFKESITEFPVCYGIGSAEGLQKVLSKWDSTLLCFDELKQFVSKCKIESSVLLPCVSTLFETNNYSNHTKSADMVIENAYLSILAASTVQTYEKIWDSSFLDIGFVNRVFIVPGSGVKQHSVPKLIPQEIKNALKIKLGDILQMIGECLSLSMDTDAFQYFDEWYMQLERSVHTKRLDTYALRFMSLLTVNECKDKIDLGIVAKVCHLMDWQLEMRRNHDPIDAESGIARMEEKIRRILKSGPVSDRELKQRTNANRSGVWLYQTACKNLSNNKEIAWNKIQNIWQLR